MKLTTIAALDISLFGCSGGIDRDVERGIAQELCRSHGGIDYMAPTFPFGQPRTATCVDGWKRRVPQTISDTERLPGEGHE